MRRLNALSKPNKVKQQQLFYAAAENGAKQQSKLSSLKRPSHKFTWCCVQKPPEPMIQGQRPPIPKLHITLIPKMKKKKQTLLQDYFPVRRSCRKTSTYIKQEKLQEVEEAIITGNEAGFQIKQFPGKGRGVISNRPIAKGNFVLEYSGELIDVDEAKRREYLYSNNDKIGCYMYYFHYLGKNYCVDATKDTGRLGRLVNHSSKSGNMVTKALLVNETPHLILVAARDILAGEELLYDYGDRSKKSLQAHPWLAL